MCWLSLGQITAWELHPGPASTLTIAPTKAQLSTQWSRQASAGHFSKSRPQPSQDMKPGSAPGTSPSPRTSALAPRDRAGCPSLTAQCRASLSLTPRSVLALLRASGHKLQGPEPIQDREICSVLTCSPHETSTTRAESHRCPLPYEPQIQALMTNPGPQ